MVNRYVNPLVDYAFKKIFAEEGNKDLLIAFLNEVLQGRKHIVDLVYNKNEYPDSLKNEGGVVFDIICTDDKGEQFIIEVQRGKQKFFKERALFYTSRLITDQAPKGNRKDWGHKLTEVYLVAIMEDFMVDNTMPETHLHNIAL